MLSKISNSAISENILFEIGRGSVPGFTPITITGNNPAAESALETVWDEGGLYGYPGSAAQMTISSASANDVNITGTGAWQVFVAGLNANFNWIYEIVNLNGQTPVSTVNYYLRINWMFIYKTGVQGRNLGLVYIGTGTVTTGKPLNVYGVIGGITYTQDNQMKQAVFTVPKGHQALVTGFLAGAGTGKQISYGIYHRVNGFPFRGGGELTLVENTQQVVLRTPQLFPEETDLELRCFGAPTQEYARANFTIILERIDTKVPFILPGSLTTSTTWKRIGA